MPFHRLLVSARFVPVFLLGVFTASAASVSESVTFDSDDFSGSFTTSDISLVLDPQFSGSFAGFDSSLGTLESVYLSISFDFVSSLTLGASGGGGSFSGGGNVYWQFGLPEQDVVYGTGGGVGNGGAPFSVASLNFSMIAGGTNSALNFAKVADQLYTLTFMPGLTLGKPADATATYGLGSGKIEVTYTYSPIPEPASITALVGFGALGLVGLRRRRASA